MLTHRWPGHPRARALGISLLILSLAHAPLPRADFHNVRHHDAPGEVCEFHDHLLRWHPDAGQADDVALLHWHWVLPPSPAGPGHSGEGTGPILHAHADGWEAVAPEAGPAVVPDSTSRWAAVAAPPRGAPDFDPAILAHPVDRVARRDGAGPVHAFAATFAPRASLSSWLQRWTC